MRSRPPSVGLGGYDAQRRIISARPALVRRSAPLYPHSILKPAPISPARRRSLALAPMLAVALALAAATTAPQPALAQEEATGSSVEASQAATSMPPAPAVDARAWVIVDQGSGKRLGGEEAEDRLPMASTTK